LIDYSHFINLHQGQPTVIVGGSKGIERFPYKDFNGVVISMGDVPLRANNIFKTDYWVFANAHWIRPWLSRDADAINFINPKMIFVATNAFAFQPVELIKNQINESFKNIKTDLFYYDQRHFSGSPCAHGYAGCCSAYKLLGIKHTIQEVTKEFFNTEDLYSAGSTVAIQALSIAILMGCSPIYIIGVDIPLLQKDYTYFNSEEGDFLIEKFGSMGPFGDGYTKITLKSALKKFLPKSLVKTYKSFFLSQQQTDFKMPFETILSDFSYLGKLVNLQHGANKIFNLNPNSALVDLDYIDTLNIEEVIFR
jgi:hypothetical protein